MCIMMMPASVRAADARPWNVIIMLVDDWGWRDAHCFGSDLYETPNMDKLAAEGEKFTSGYAACTVCSPTRAAMMTGLYPARTHVTDWIPGHMHPKDKMAVPDWTQYLDLKYTTIAEAMRARGYHTAHIGKWHLTPRSDDPKVIEPYFPQHQGFDINIAGNQWGSPATYYFPYFKGKTDPPVIGRTANFPEDIPNGQYLTDMLCDHVAGLIDRWKDEPFFLYYATYAVHAPVQGRPDLVEHYKPLIKPGMQHHNAQYAALVTGVDQALAKVRAALKRNGLEDRTIIILTGDNGGLTIQRDGPTDNSPLRAGKGSAYEGGVRVPTIIYWPGVTRPGSVCDEPVITMDYYPTVLDMIGAKSHVPVDGVSLLPILKNPNSKLDRDAIYWHYPHYHPGGASPYAAVRARDWKLVEFYEEPHVELYNLADDIGEKHDLAAKMPEKAKELTDMLHRWQKSVGAQFATMKSK